MPLDKQKIFYNVKRYFQNQFGKKERILASILLVFVCVLLFFYGVYRQSSFFYRQGEKEAIALGKKHVGLKEVDDFYYFNRGKTYFAVKGKNAKKETLYVLLPQEGGKMQVLKEKEGISDNDALKQVLAKKNVKKVDKIALGIHKDRLVWELTARSTKNQLLYYYLDFKTGKEVEVIDNI